MNNKTMWIVGGVVVLVVLGFLLFGRGKSSKTEQSNNTTNTQANSPAPVASTPMSLADLANSSSSQTCTFTDASGTGTVFVASGKVRADFSSMEAGKAVGGHMILDNGTSYLWLDGQTTGFKSKISATSNPTGQQGLDANQKLNYNCQSWSADASKFALPTGVTFTDMSSLKIPGTY